MRDNLGNMILCSLDDVEKAFDELPNKFTAGMDNIPCNLIKHSRTARSHPLLNIINHSLMTGKFPTLWKESKSIPIFKSGNKSNIENYRLISILSGLSKVFGIFLFGILFSYSKLHISENQHGFTPGKFTVTNLLVLANYIQIASSTGHQLDVIYTDFSKAFDKLNISKLFDKINELGTLANLTQVSISYLFEIHAYWWQHLPARPCGHKAVWMGSRHYTS